MDYQISKIDDWTGSIVLRDGEVDGIYPCIFHGIANWKDCEGGFAMEEVLEGDGSAETGLRVAEEVAVLEDFMDFAVYGIDGAVAVFGVEDIF